MKILLVNPAKYDENGDRESYRVGSIPPSGLVILASRIKKFSDVHVRIVDEWIEDIPFEEHFDLVGISTLFSATFPRVADISRRFRERGIPVVLGGTHATCAPSEAAAIADSVVLGEGEGLFEDLVSDLLSGSGLKPEYSRNGFFDLETEAYVEPDYSLLNMDRYLKVGLCSGANIFPIHTSRGCPMNCRFCSIHITAGRQPRYRPIRDVVRDILTFKDKYAAKYFGFYDDNLTLDPTRFSELMREIGELDIRFWCQISSAIARRPEMIELLAKSGCVSALIGVESINQESLEEASKTLNEARAYKDMFALFRKYRVTTMASMIFGFDHDSPDVFSESVRFLNSCKVPRALFNILVPFPGTRLYSGLAAEGRIEETNLSLYDVTHVVFRPKLMTKKQLQDGFWRAYVDFYRLGPILRRVLRSGNSNRLYTLFGSLTFRRQIRRRIYPYSSGFRRVTRRNGQNLAASNSAESALNRPGQAVS